MTEFKDIHGRAITVAILFVCLFACSAFGDDDLIVSAGSDQGLDWLVKYEENTGIVEINMEDRGETIIVFDNLNSCNFNITEIDRWHMPGNWAGDAPIKSITLKFGKKYKPTPINL